MFILSSYLTNAECELEGLVSVHGGVKLGAGAEFAGVVHGQLVTRPGHAAAAGRNVLNLQTTFTFQEKQFYKGDLYEI